MDDDEGDTGHSTVMAAASRARVEKKPLLKSSGEAKSSSSTAAAPASLSSAPKPASSSILSSLSAAVAKKVKRVRSTPVPLDVPAPLGDDDEDLETEEGLSDGVLLAQKAYKQQHSVTIKQRRTDSTDTTNGGTGSSVGGPRNMATWQHAALATYWFGWSFLWMPLLIVIIPKQIGNILNTPASVIPLPDGTTPVPISEGSAMGTTLLFGSFASICAPIFGSYSDSSQHKMGRRRPFMIVGTVLASLALFVMAISPSLGCLSVAFLCLSLANNMILAPYSALVPDIVTVEQRGTASGWLGGMSIAGYLMAGVLSYKIDDLGILGAYLVMIVIHGGAMVVTCYCIDEHPLATVVSPTGVCSRTGSFMTPMRSHDFRVVFFTRFLMQMGIITVQEYLQWYLRDAIGVANFIISGSRVADSETQAVAILFIPVLLGAFISALASGVISDRYGGARKKIVYASGALMALASVLFALTRSYAFDMFLGLLFGVGFGSFSVMDWALATDVLPNKDEFAKDMGIWSLAMVLPQVVAAPIAGVLLDWGQSLSTSWSLGYTFIFLLAVVYYVAGTVFVKYVEGVE